MSTKTSRDELNEALKLATLMVGNRQLQSQFADSAERRKLQQKHGLSDAAMLSLDKLLERLQLRGKGAAETRQPDVSSKRAVGQDEAERFRRIIWDSFQHIRWSFWISILMSIALFVIGAALIGIAVMKALGPGEMTIETLTIGGLGLGDFLILFLRRPWEDVGKNLSNTQQVRIIVTSYLSSLSLIQQQRSADLKLLAEVTANSVKMIQDFTEEPREKIPAQNDQS